MYSSNYIQSKDGINLFYQTWTPSHPKAVIIIVHGAGEHSGRYQPITAQCVNHEIAVVAPDLRGFGQSDGARGHINTFQEYIDDLHTLVEWVSAQFQHMPIFLFGHSLGGLIVIRYSQIYAYETNGVILSSPALALRFELPSFSKKILAVASSVLPNLSIRPNKWERIFRAITSLEPYLPKKKELKKDPLMTSQYTPRWLFELIQNGVDAIAEAALFQFPVLFVYDQKDPIIHPRFIQDFFHSVSIPDKHFVTFNDGFHHPLQAHYRDLALDNVMQWINKRL
ncbi:alpha/beta hydrolase [Gracilibacillus thailandensis]|nr:alpha/beta hydrolase [Gracilibacillus thailandensis]